MPRSYLYRYKSISTDVTQLSNYVTLLVNHCKQWSYVVILCIRKSVGEILKSFLKLLL